MNDKHNWLYSKVAVLDKDTLATLLAILIHQNPVPAATKISEMLSGITMLTLVHSMMECDGRVAECVNMCLKELENEDSETN